MDLYMRSILKDDVRVTIVVESQSSKPASQLVSEGNGGL